MLNFIPKQMPDGVFFVFWVVSLWRLETNNMQEHLKKKTNELIESYKKLVK